MIIDGELVWMGYFMDKQYTRKELSAKLNIGIETLRYYENAGIIPKPARSSSGYRIYNEDDLLRLKFIIRAKDMGFRLKEIETIFQPVSGDISINSQLIQEQITLKIDELGEKITALNELKDALENLKQNGRIADCGLLNFLYKS